MKTKLVSVLIGAVISCILWGGVVWAQEILSKEVDVEVTLLEGTKDIEVYQDPGMTIPATAIVLRDLYIGQVELMDFYVKGTGQQAVFIDVRASSGIELWAGYRVIPSGGAWVRPGGFQEFKFYLEVDPTTMAGSKTFKIEFYEAVP